MLAGDVIEHIESKHRFLVVEVIPFNIRIRSVWGYYFTIGKRRLSEFIKIGVRPKYIERSPRVRGDGPVNARRRMYRYPQTGEKWLMPKSWQEVWDADSEHRRKREFDAIPKLVETSRDYRYPTRHKRIQKAPKNVGRANREEDRK